MNNETICKAINKHQKIIDEFLKYKKNDICYVTQNQIAKSLGVSQSLIEIMIKEINAETTAIKKIKRGQYKILIENLEQEGTYKKIIDIMEKIKDNNAINIKLLSEEMKVKEKTVRSALGYYYYKK